jgi:hypothetical protein
MSTTEERLSWAAIILSGAAFVISVSQALQQYLATAEGYRRCQKKVLGPWAEGYTRRKLRLRELRFETLFGTPRITLSPIFDQPQCFSLRNSHSLISGEDSLARSLVPNEAEIDLDSNVNWVCWLRLLEELKDLHLGLLKYLPRDRNMLRAEKKPPSLHEPQQLGHGSEPSFNFPSFILEHQSWDFVPADVLKPLASKFKFLVGHNSCTISRSPNALLVIGISDLAICMRRMGLRWIQFQPSDAALRAEGNDISLTSSYLRAVGCVVTYTRVRGKSGNMRFPTEKYLIPNNQADAMGFGLLPSCHKTARPFFDLSTISSVLDVFESFHPSDDALKRLRDLSQKDNFFYAFLDLIPLTTPFMRWKNSPIVRIPAPIDRPFWLFHSATGRTAFRYLLRQELEKRKAKKSPSEQDHHFEKLTTVRDTYEGLVRDYPHLNNATKADWLRMSSNSEDIELLDKIHDEFDKIQQYFVAKTEGMCGLRADGGLPTESEAQFDGPDLYSDLVTVHLRHAILADEYAERNLKDPGLASQRYVYPQAVEKSTRWDRRIAEALGQYSNRWKYMMKELEEMGWVVGGEAHFLELWTQMMMRGFYWEFCHFMVEQPRVPAGYWNSKMPIYIG